MLEEGSNFIISIDHSINADNGTIRVLNMSGHLVKKLNVQQQNRISLNIKDPGVYIVQLVNGKETITKNLIVVSKPFICHGGTELK